MKKKSNRPYNGKLKMRMASIVVTAQEGDDGRVLQEVNAGLAELKREASHVFLKNGERERK